MQGSWPRSGIVGALLFALSLWVALVLGRYAAGTWLLSLVDVDDRWAALLVGLVVLGFAARLPRVGGLVDLVVVLLGPGAMTLGGYAGLPAPTDVVTAGSTVMRRGRLREPVHEGRHPHWAGPATGGRAGDDLRRWRGGP